MNVMLILKGETLHEVTSAQSSQINSRASYIALYSLVKNMHAVGPKILYETSE